MNKPNFTFQKDSAQAAAKPGRLFLKLGIAAMALSLSSAGFALPKTNPGDPDMPNGGPGQITVEGTLTFQGCTPAPSDVTVRTTQPYKVSYPSASMHYSIVIGTTNSQLPGQVTVTPQVKSSVCGVGTFTPASLTVAPGAKGVNFSYQAPVASSFSIPVDSFILFANGFLANVGLHLNNDAGHAGQENQNSHITINGVTTAFDIPPAKVDLPFPLPGSALFYIRDMNKDGAQISQVGTGNSFNLGLHFESNGIELKGYHSDLGDSGIPDFQMSNISFNTAAALRVSNAKLGVAFLSTKLTAGISSTGGCNIFGIDWCNALFGTSGTVRQQFEQAIGVQLQGSTIQAALQSSLASALAGFGINGPIGTVAVQNGQIVITTICTTSPLLCGRVILPGGGLHFSATQVGSVQR
jgi:hypothetical protein